jgi:hypothetical protein
MSLPARARAPFGSPGRTDPNDERRRADPHGGGDAAGRDGTSSPPVRVLNPP